MLIYIFYKVKKSEYFSFKQPPYDLIRITKAFLGKKKKARGHFLVNKMLRDLGRMLHIDNALQVYYQIIKASKPLFYLKKIRKGRQTIDSPTIITERKANYLVLNWINTTIKLTDTELFAKTLIRIKNKDLSCEAYRLSLDYLIRCKKALVNLQKNKPNILNLKYLRKKKNSTLFKKYKQNQL